jgi:hypothetical protein
MNSGAAINWREIVDKHCASLVDDLASRLDSELNQVRSEGLAAAEASQREVEAARREVEAARAQAALDLEVARGKAVEEAQAAAAEFETRLEAAHAQFALDSETARKQGARQSAIGTAEFLNQAFRRLREAASQAEALSILLESTASYCRSAVVLRVENGQVSSLGARGLSAPGDFPLDSAPALASVAENRDPVVALSTPGELGEQLAHVLGSGDSAGKAYLFPVAARQEVIAILVAAGEPMPALLELLCGAAGMKLEALDAPVPAALKPLPSPELVQIVPSAVPETPGADRIAWADLSAEDQRLHLQAQRVARVKVAEMRLHHAEELRKGVFSGDIYGALKVEIDRAREEFLKSFLAKSRTMVDYLHLEILRSLAHEDDRLLGHEYPGPMV